MSRANRIVFFVLLTVCVAAFVGSSVHAFKTGTFHVDETYWAAEGIYFKLFFVDLDFRHPAWRDYWGKRNPPLVKYIYGLSLMLSGHPIDDFELRNVYGRSWADPVVLERETPVEILTICRRTSWVFGVMTAVALFVVARSLIDRWLGLIAVLLLSLDRLYMSFFARAMSESIVNFLWLLFLLACLLFFRRDRTVDISWRDFLSMLAVSATIALLALAKPSGPLAGLIFAIVAVAFYAVAARGGREEAPTGRVIGASVKVAVLVAVVGFNSIVPAIAFNPYLHRDPYGNARTTLETWEKHVEAQQEREGGGALHTLGDKLAFFGEHGFPVGRPGNTPVTIVNVALLALGLAAVGVRGIRRTRETSRLSPELIFILWGVVGTGAQILWVPLRWPRYALAAHPFVILLQSAAIYVMVRAALRAWSGRSA
jgi:hypothetical protein